jgi:hypothetical protein
VFLRPSQDDDRCSRGTSVESAHPEQIYHTNGELIVQHRPSLCILLAGDATRRQNCGNSAIPGNIRHGVNQKGHCAAAQNLDAVD